MRDGNGLTVPGTEGDTWENEIVLDGITFYAHPDKGAWYTEEGDKVGALYAPMYADGSLPEAEEVGEIEVTYEEA